MLRLLLWAAYTAVAALGWRNATSSPGAELQQREADADAVDFVEDEHGSSGSGGDVGRGHGDGNDSASDDEITDSRPVHPRGFAAAAEDDGDGEVSGFKTGVVSDSKVAGTDGGDAQDDSSSGGGGGGRAAWLPSGVLSASPRRARGRKHGAAGAGSGSASGFASSRLLPQLGSGGFDAPAPEVAAWRAEAARLHGKLAAVDRSLAVLVHAGTAADAAAVFGASPSSSPLDEGLDRGHSPTQGVLSPRAILAAAATGAAAGAAGRAAFSFSGWRDRLAALAACSAPVAAAATPGAAGAAALLGHADAARRSLDTIATVEGRWNSGSASAAAAGFADSAAGGSGIVQLAAEHRALAASVEEAGQRLQAAQERSAAVSLALNETTEGLEAAEEAVAARSDDLSGSSRMGRLRAALADLRRQRRAMDVEVGLLANAVLRANAKLGMEQLASGVGAVAGAHTTATSAVGKIGSRLAKLGESDSDENDEEAD